jgi:hypothetical protein
MEILFAQPGHSLHRRPRGPDHLGKDAVIKLGQTTHRETARSRDRRSTLSRAVSIVNLVELAVLRVSWVQSSWGLRLHQRIDNKPPTNHRLAIWAKKDPADIGSRRKVPGYVICPTGNVGARHHHHHQNITICDSSSCGRPESMSTFSITPSFYY